MMMFQKIQGGEFHWTIGLNKKNKSEIWQLQEFFLKKGHPAVYNKVDE